MYRLRRFTRVEERVPGKQGLKLDRYRAEQLVKKSRRASSRKTRIETPQACTPYQTLSQVEERVPGKQGLKQRMRVNHCVVSIVVEERVPGKQGLKRHHKYGERVI